MNMPLSLSTAPAHSTEPSMQDADPILELRNLSKTFGEVEALRGVELAVQPGEFVTVVGPSGCGKSTLFNIVSGLEEPDSGSTLRFERRSVMAKSLLGRVSFMPQRDLLLAWRNVIDNAILPLEIEGANRAEARAEAERMLPEFGLAGFADKYPHELSGGMAPARGADADLYVQARSDAARRAFRSARCPHPRDDAALVARGLAEAQAHGAVHHPRC